MRSPPLLEEHPRSVQILLAIVLPAAFGAVTGYFLGVSEGTYLVLSILGVLGGVGAGYDHHGAAAGAKRGILAGSIFGAAILIAHEIHGAEAEAHLPDPAILLVVITTVLGVLGGIGAGFDHVGAAAGAKRGVLAGSIFGAAILIAHEIHGAEAEAHLPEPAILLVVITTVLGVAFAALGGWLRARATRPVE